MIVSEAARRSSARCRPRPPGHTYQAWGLRRRTAASPVPLPTFSGNGDVVILDDVGHYDEVGDHGRAERRLAGAVDAPFTVATL